MKPFRSRGDDVVARLDRAEAGIVGLLLDQLEQLGIEMFDLVVVNLYPFRATVASGASPDECIEQIDIGGPAMIRASAKNHPSVATVVEPSRFMASA